MSAVQIFMLCSNPDCREQFSDSPSPYGGATEAEAMAAARHEGWTINEQTNKAACPLCGDEWQPD